MSLRNIRKIYGTTELPDPEGGPEEFQPSYVQKHNKSLYMGLEVSSNSEPEANSSDGEPEPPPVQQCVKRRRNNKKKKKQRRKQETDPDLQMVEEIDEVEQAVMEVNAILGEPEKPLPGIENPIKFRRHLFAVKNKYFDAEEELTRRFGPELDDDDDISNNSAQRRGRRLNLRPIDQHKAFIIPTDKVYKTLGLSMRVVERKDDFTYYAFVHERDYQMYHQSFLREQHDEYFLARYLNEAPHRMLVEGMLEIADREYYMESFSSGNKVIEEVICYMQQIARQNFSFTNIRVRLLYKHVENRAFHIALLKHMHMLTNKACHRTALEVGKLLLNLDPSDPLAVLFIIDSVAIRAGEYQWLLCAIEYWTEERDAGFLFNIMYSTALAEYHLAKKRRDGLPPNWKETWAPDEEDIPRRQRTPESDDDGKDEFYRADKLLMGAVVQFPAVVTKILKIAGVRNNNVFSCKLFNPEIDDGSSSNLKSLMGLYAKFIWHRFTEDDVLKWLLRNVLTVVEKHNTDPAFQKLAKEYANRRMNLFQTYPAEILRHLSIITPLSNLIVDGAVPDIGPVCSYDPHPPLDGINPYEALSESVTTSFFSSILPDQELLDAAMDRMQDLPQEIGMDEAPVPTRMVVFRPPFTDSESESDDTDDGFRHIEMVETLDPPEIRVRGTVRFFVDFYDNMFEGAANDNFVDLSRHGIQNRRLLYDDSDDDDEAYILIAQGPPQMVEIEHDSDEDGEPDENPHLSQGNRIVTASLDSLEPLSDSSDEPQDGTEEPPPNDEIRSNDREIPDLGGDDDAPDDYEDYDQDETDEDDRNSEDEDENEDRDGDDDEDDDRNDDIRDDEDDGEKKDDEDSEDDEDDDFNIDLEEFNFYRQGEAGKGENGVVQRSAYERNNANQDSRNIDVAMASDNDRDSENINMDHDENKENETDEDEEPKHANIQNSDVEDNITETMNCDNEWNIDDKNNTSGD